jgi:hypothetical protein
MDQLLQELLVLQHAETAALCFHASTIRRHPRGALTFVKRAARA